MPTTSYINLEKKIGANNYKPLDVILCRGEGVWVSDVDGKRYLWPIVMRMPSRMSP